MWVLLLILSAVCPAFTSKEHALLQDLPTDEKNIFLELVKRLENEDTRKLGWNDMAECRVSTNKTSIIKKNESLTNGATFLTIYKNIENNEACSDLCCSNSSCDMAVFENKGDHYCYLFRCKGKCKFGHHSSYISNTLVHRSLRPPPDGSELDLIDLDSVPVVDNSNDKDGSLRPAPVVTTTMPTTTAVYIRAHSVGLEGPCERDVHCEDPSAVCSSRRCRCQGGYYMKGHTCRQVCPPSNFECLELGTHGRGVECVSRDKVCDSIMQCADGSDEFNCPDTDVPYTGTDVKIPDVNPVHEGGSQTGGEHKVDASKAGDHDQAQPTGDKTVAGDHRPDSAQAPSSVDANGNKPANKTDEGIQDVPASSQTAGSTDTDAGSSSEEGTDTGSSSEEGTDAGSSSEEGGGDKGGDSEETKGAANKEKDSEKTGDGGNHSKSPKNSFISREKMDWDAEPTSMQGPIIALSLGLAFTVILLVFVACRLRNVRRRLRKGRPLHSNEADYLINGMYL